MIKSKFRSVVISVSLFCCRSRKSSTDRGWVEAVGVMRCGARTSRLPQQPRGQAHTRGCDVWYVARHSSYIVTTINGFDIKSYYYNYNYQCCVRKRGLKTYNNDTSSRRGARTSVAGPAAAAVVVRCGI